MAACIHSTESTRKISCSLIANRRRVTGNPNRTLTIVISCSLRCTGAYMPLPHRMKRRGHHRHHLHQQRERSKKRQRRRGGHHDTAEWLEVIVFVVEGSTYDNNNQDSLDGNTHTRERKRAGLLNDISPPSALSFI